MAEKEQPQQPTHRGDGNAAAPPSRSYRALNLARIICFSGLTLLLWTGFVLAVHYSPLLFH